MKIISFDVGIKNMAYCIFSLNDSSFLHQFSFNMPPSALPPSAGVVAEMNGLDRLLSASSMRKGVNKFTIADWNVVSLLEKDEPHINCTCIKVKVKAKAKAKAKVNKKVVAGTIQSIDDNICNRIGKFKRGSNIYCDKHAKAQTEWLIPQARFSQKNLKKTKIDDLIKLASELKIENIAKRRADIIKQFEDFVVNKCLEPVSVAVKQNAGHVDLVSIGRKMREVFDIALTNHKDITHVIIENQISPLANRMKTIQGMLSQYFIMVYDSIIIDFISSANKLKIFTSKDNSKDKVDVEVQTDSQKYKSHKKDGVYYSQQVLNNNNWISNNKWNSIFESKKKDDLADCFLQGLWYLCKNNKITMNEEFQIS